MPARCVIQHIAGGDGGDMGGARQFGVFVKPDGVVGAAAEGQGGVRPIAEVRFQAMQMFGRRRGAKNGDHAFGRGGEIVPGEVAAAFAGAAFAGREQAAEAGVGWLVRGVDEDGGPVRQVETGADNDAHIRFFGALMGADDAGQRAAVGDAESGDFEDGGAGEQLLDVGGAAEEGEVRGRLEFGVQDVLCDSSRL